MQHTDLIDSRWHLLSIEEQLANIGSEVIRALNWKEKGISKISRSANFRALELLDLTLTDRCHEKGVKEIARLRELWMDFYYGENCYRQTAEQWKKYFSAFTYAARKNI